MMIVEVGLYRLRAEAWVVEERNIDSRSGGVAEVVLELVRFVDLVHVFCSCVWYQNYC